MSTNTISVLLLAFVCCGWPLIVHGLWIFIQRRDWSASGDLISRVIAYLFSREND